MSWASNIMDTSLFMADPGTSCKKNILNTHWELGWTWYGYLWLKLETKMLRVIYHFLNKHIEPKNRLCLEESSLPTPPSAEQHLLSKEIEPEIVCNQDSKRDTETAPVDYKMCSLSVVSCFAHESAWTGVGWFSKNHKPSGLKWRKKPQLTCVTCHSTLSRPF